MADDDDYKKDLDKLEFTSEEALMLAKNGQALPFHEAIVGLLRDTHSGPMFLSLMSLLLRTRIIGNHDSILVVLRERSLEFLLVIPVESFQELEGHVLKEKKLHSASS